MFQNPRRLHDAGVGKEGVFKRINSVAAAPAARH
jgi:hypothetical protein